MARLEVEIDPSGARSGARKIKRDLRDITKGADQATRSTERFGTKTDQAMAKAGSATNKFVSNLNLARAAVVALTAASVKGFRSGLGMDRALTEASTLLEGTTEEMSLMRFEARAMASEFGGTGKQQVEAFYQAISAGAGSVAQATSLLQTSNLLAKGGVTDITTSVDILTTAVNAYAASGLTATDASDILFTGVKFGKTTINELASSLGRAAPLAAKLGVGFDELVGATAALTKGGVSTAEAITGMRGIMAAVLKPTSEAEEAAARLGLQFNAAAIKAKGFSGFLKDVIAKTGGSSEELAILFGGMEGLAGVLGLATNGGADFNAAMESMGTSLGATQEAADKVSESLSDRLDVSMSTVSVATEKFGTVLMQIIIPAFEFLIRNIDILAVSLGTLALAGTIGKVISLGVAVKGLGAGFTIAYGAVSLFNSAMTFFGGPIGMAITAAAALAGGLYYLATRHSEAAVAAREHAEWEAKTADAIGSAKEALRSYARSTVIDTVAIEERYGEMATKIIQSLQRVIDFELEQSIKKTMEGVTQSFSLIDGVTDGFSAELAQLEKGLGNITSANFFGNMDTSVIDERIAELNQMRGILDGSLEVIGATAVEIEGLGVPAHVFQDFVRLRTSFEEAIQTGQWDDAFVAVGNLTDMLQYIPDGPLRDAILQVELLSQDLADSAIAAGQVETAVDTITPAVAAAVAETKLLEQAFLDSMSAANRLEALGGQGGRGSGAEYLDPRGEAGQTFDEWEADNPEPSASGGGGEAKLALLDTTKAAYDSLRASMDTAYAAELQLASGQMIVGEALSAGIIGTEQAGEALTMLERQFGLATDAGMKMQEKLADSIANSMGDALMSVVDGTKTVGEAFRTMALAIAKELFQVIVIEQMVLALKTAIGGFGDGGLFSGGDVVPSANGNLFSGGNVVPFANGGVVNSPTLFPMSSGIGLMGEAGPEAIMPLSRGSDGKLGVKNNGGGSGGSGDGGDVNIHNYFDLEAAMDGYLSSPEGRRNIMNMVGEEQAA